MSEVREPAPGITTPGDVRRARRTLNGAMTALIVATVAGVVWGGLTVVRANTNAQYALAEAAHAREVTTQANGVLSAAVHTQSGLNGFLATDDVAFLAEYHVGLNDIQLRSADLDVAVAVSNLPPGADVVLQRAARAILVDLRATLNTARTQGMPQARAHLQAGRSHELTGTIRTEVDEVSTAANEHATSAAVRAETYLHRSVGALTATAGLVLISLGVLWGLVIQRGRWGRQRDDLLAEVAAASVLDPLTGLGNRRALAQHMAAPDGDDTRDVTLVFVDLDGFKAVNDSCGHETGDAYLVAVADSLRAAVRGTDFLARVGGDEFVVVVEGSAPIYDADCVTQRVRRAVALASAYCERTYGGPGIGASIGVSRRSELPEPQQVQPVMDALMRHADTAMYIEKRAHKAFVDS